MTSPFRWLSAPASFLTAIVLASQAAAGPGPQAFFHHPIVTVGANHSNNWSGYNQGIVEQNGTAFHAISGTWVVPTATAHKAGENEFSSTWVGIGGGCIDAGCSATDSTLIQAGTEQDVDTTGTASYHAWWEIIPLPSTPVSLPVNAGDRVTVTIRETLPAIWSIAIANFTTGQSWSTTTPYLSTYATAEWIVETPIVVDSSGTVGIGPLPNLSTVTFDNGAVNSVPVALRSSEAIQLVGSKGEALATPSSPDSDLDGFNDCAYAASCAAPASPSVKASSSGTIRTGSNGPRNRNYGSGKRRTPDQAQAGEWASRTSTVDAAIVSTTAASVAAYSSLGIAP